MEKRGFVSGAESDEGGFVAAGVGVGLEGSGAVGETDLFQVEGG